MEVKFPRVRDAIEKFTTQQKSCDFLFTDT